MVLTPGQALDPSEQEPWARGQAVGEIFSIIISKKYTFSNSPELNFFVFRTFVNEFFYR